MEKGEEISQRAPWQEAVPLTWSWGDWRQEGLPTMVLLSGLLGSLGFGVRGLRAL